MRLGATPDPQFSQTLYGKVFLDCWTLLKYSVFTCFRSFHSNVGVFCHQHCDVLCLEALPALLQASLDHEESVRVAAPASHCHIRHTFVTHSSHIRHTIRHTFVTHSSHIRHTFVTHSSHIRHTFVTHSSHIPGLWCFRCPFFLPISSHPSLRESQETCENMWKHLSLKWYHFSLLISFNIFQSSLVYIWGTWSFRISGCLGLAKIWSSLHCCPHVQTMSKWCPDDVRCQGLSSSAVLEVLTDALRDPSWVLSFDCSWSPWLVFFGLVTLLRQVTSYQSPNLTHLRLRS